MFKAQRLTVLFVVFLTTLLSGISQAYAGVALGTTRVVYPAGQKQVSLGISNNDEKSTYLIQSWIDNADGAKTNSFVITPPLFVMKGKKENTLRIIDGTNNSLPADKETLLWVNVKAIPSVDKAMQDKNTLQLAIISRIKMFYRPKGLAMTPEKAPASLQFSRSGNTLTVKNPSPYYVTVTNVISNKKELKSFMVLPMGSITTPIPAGASNAFSYQTINDFGALTPAIQVNVN